MAMRSRLLRRLAAGVVLFAVGLAGVTPAQRKAAPAAGRPTLEPVVPPGAQRGTALDFTLSGAHLTDPLAVGLSFSARVTSLTNLPAGKDSTKIRARVE